MIPNGPPDLKTANELAEIQFTDYQARRGMTPPWANGRHGKEYRSVMGRRPVGGIFSVGLEEAYRWKDSVQSEPEIRLWVAEGTANGMRPWFTKFSGTLYDRRWLPVVERIYDVARPARALSAQRDAAGARRAAALGTDGGRCTPAWHKAIGRRITCSACTTRSSRRGCRSRWSTRRCSRPNASIASSC